MHIGQKIKEVLEQRHRPVTWLAREINCERTNVYNIFSRKDISTGLLQKIGVILEYDFFKDLSEEYFKGGKPRKWKILCNFAHKYENRNICGLF